MSLKAPSGAIGRPAGWGISTVSGQSGTSNPMLERLKQPVASAGTEAGRVDFDLPGISLKLATVAATRAARRARRHDSACADVLLFLPAEMLDRAPCPFRAAFLMNALTFDTGQEVPVSPPMDQGIYHVLTVQDLQFAPPQAGLALGEIATLHQQGLALQMLRSAIRTISEWVAPPNGQDNLTRNAQELAARHLRETVQLLAASTRMSPVGGADTPDARIEHIRAEILRNAPDPEFSLHCIARDLGLSPGYIRKLLARQDLRFSNLLRAARLDIARRRLCAAHQRHITITEIALDCGFSDISYFNRCFKQKFAMTPSDARRAA